MEINEALSGDDIIFLDVRSPKEYEEDHILGAVNLPILDDEERAIIGTIYKQEGKHKAVIKGFDFVTPKLKILYEKLSELAKTYSKVVVYCFRGGMRSSSVVNFASSCGLKVEKLDGGYKAYRNFVLGYLNSIDEKFEFAVIHGNTGVGKTEILKKLEREGIPILDIEEFAQNAGSVFGGIYYSANSPSQKFFETKIFNALYKYEKDKKNTVFMESESKKIGRCTLQNNFFEKMKSGKHILAYADIESRVKRCVADYTSKEVSDELLISAIDHLKDKLGKKVVDQLNERVLEKDYNFVAKFLMENYYDKLYMYSQTQYQYEITVDTGDIQDATIKIQNWYKEQ